MSELEEDARDAAQRVRQADVPMDADVFIRQTLRDLAGALQQVIGLKEARGFISIVGARLGDRFNSLYRSALGKERLDREEVAEVLVDLKRRIGGDFYVIEATDKKIVLGNRRCPFGDFVKDRPGLCMMTSNVFGRVTAENLGYAKVRIEEAIAEGWSGCRVVVYLDRLGEAYDAPGREYYRVEGT